MDKIDEVLTRGVEKIYPSKEALAKKLRSGKKIRLYQGFDPSMPNLHLGNLVGLLKLKQFQDLGHEVIFLVGDFTGMIGDPTDKTSSRPQLTRKKVLENCKNWQEQAGRILKFKGKNPAKILYNSQWLSKLSFAELINLAHHLTYQQTIKRDMFRKRLKEGKDIYLHEFLYPLMQGYDSVHMDVDLEIGGSDQMFNMLVGRDLMRKIKGKEKSVMTTKLLVDAEGKKVGKTTGNALFLNASAAQLYGGIMSFPDEVISLAFELLTLVPLQSIKEIDKQGPMIAKKRLALEIVKLYHGEKEAQQAQEEFERVFQKKEAPKKMRTKGMLRGDYSLVALVFYSAQSRSKTQAKNLIKDGGVKVNGKAILDPQTKIKIRKGKELVLKIGRLEFLKIKGT